MMIMKGYYLQGVDDTWDVSQDCQEDVNEEVGVAAAFEENPERWEDDGEYDFADVAIFPMISAMIRRRFTIGAQQLAFEEDCSGEERKGWDFAIS